MTNRLGLAGAMSLLVIGIPVVSAHAADQVLPSSTLADIDILDEAPSLQFSAGAFNVIRDHGYATNEDVSGEGRIELRSGSKVGGLGLLVGAMANTDEAAFGYAAVYTDVALGNWVFSPSAGAGAYFQGDSKDLGGTFQFHVAVDFGYRFAGGTMLGVKFTHISNAGINPSNPGTESALLTFSIPLGN